MHNGSMARYEVAIETPLAFSSSRTDPFRTDDRTVIEFDGRRFVWHAGQEIEDKQCWPVVTVMVLDADDYADERLATNKFLSALSFVLDHPMSIATSAATGYKGELDRPILGQPGHAATIITAAISTVTVDDDDRLRLVLALFREGRSANSPFYKFLAFYNALDAAFDNDEPARDATIRALLNGSPMPESQPAEGFDWADYLWDVLRNAVAHAVRREGKAVLNPDDLADRRTLDMASASVVGLLRRRVNDRWPGGVAAR